MTDRLQRTVGPAALAASLLALGAVAGGVAWSAGSTPSASTTPRSHGLLRLNGKGQFPAKVVPTVARAELATRATTADRLGSRTPDQVRGACAPGTVDLGTWCLDASVHPAANGDVGGADYAAAGQACERAGGVLPTAAQLVGAAAKLRLSGTIHDSPGGALTSDSRDLREMSATLTTVNAGSEAAGDQRAPGGSSPASLQYVTVFDNGDKGGFAGSAPVGQPERFRCAYHKAIQPAGAKPPAAPAPKLALTVARPKAARRGRTVRLRVTLRNAGRLGASSSVLTVRPPQGVRVRVPRPKGTPGKGFKAPKVGRPGRIPVAPLGAGKRRTTTVVLVTSRSAGRTAKVALRVTGGGATASVTVTLRLR